jgi:hypothetical protein
MNYFQIVIQNVCKFSSLFKIAFEKIELLSQKELLDKRFIFKLLSKVRFS